MDSISASFLRSGVVALAITPLLGWGCTPPSLSAEGARAEARSTTPAAPPGTVSRIAVGVSPAPEPSDARAAAARETIEAEPVNAGSTHARTDHEPGHACGVDRCDHGSTAPADRAADAPVAKAAAGTTGLVRLGDKSAICMLSNRYLGERADVPIDVGGKTYHGCCAGCAAKLAATPETREAVDPVTGRRVDKAAAVIARDSANKLYYFESEASFARYRARRGS